MNLYDQLATETLIIHTECSKSIVHLVETMDLARKNGLPVTEKPAGTMTISIYPVVRRGWEPWISIPN